MSEYKKEDIKNLHYNNMNEIQYEYGCQTYHCSMEHLKEVLVSSWNLQQENQQLKEMHETMTKYALENEVKIDKLKEVIDEAMQHIKESCYYPELENYSNMTDEEVKELVQILDKVKE